MKSSITLFCSPVPLCKCSTFASAVAVLCQNSLVGICSIGCLIASPRGMYGSAFACFPPFWKRKMLFPSLQEGLLLMKCCKVQYDSREGSVTLQAWFPCLYLCHALLVPLCFSPGGAVSERGRELPNVLIPGHCELSGGLIFSSQTSLCSTAGWSALNSSSSAALSGLKAHALFRSWKCSGSCVFPVGDGFLSSLPTGMKWLCGV